MRQLSKLVPAITALMLLTACTNDDTKAAASEPAKKASAAAADFEILGDPHLYGPGRWGVAALGDPGAPVPVFDVPEGFQGHESWIWTDDQGPGQFAQMSSWTPRSVPVNPCNPKKSSRPVGPTVEDLAAALAAQKLTTTTAPVPVTADGHEGLYVELTTPRRFDYRACGPDGMEIWATGLTDPRALGEPVTDRYWIMDVDGQRVVISAMTLRAATSETVELITGIVEKMTFVEAS